MATGPEQNDSAAEKRHSIRRMVSPVAQRLDRILRHRWLAPPIFAVVMSGVYYFSVVWPGDVLTRWVSHVFFGEWLIPAAERLVVWLSAPEWVVSLTTEGILGGVGAVFGFVPQMAILFLMLSFLEESGYMARVALTLDRFFHGFGLSGKSVIPMLLSSGCGVPGVMAAECIENPAERRLTAMTATMIPCSAKLPVIGLVAGALAHGAWWLAPLVYFSGIAAVAISCTILRKLPMFVGPSPCHPDRPLETQLPPYRIPPVRDLFVSVWDRCRTFVIKAGTVIFIACAVIWCLSHFGWNSETRLFGLVGEEQSLLAACGRQAAWLFTPIGFGHWKAVVATVAGLVGKENIVGTLAVLQGMERITDVSHPSSELWYSMADITDGPLGSTAFLVFNLFCAPCIAAVVAIRRVMGGRRWTLLAIGWQTGFAYGAALMVYQFGRLAMGCPSPIGLTAAVLLLATIIFMLVRRGAVPASGPTCAEKCDESEPCPECPAPDSLPSGFTCPGNCHHCPARRK